MGSLHAGRLNTRPRPELTWFLIIFCFSQLTSKYALLEMELHSFVHYSTIVCHFLVQKKKALSYIIFNVGSFYNT